MHLLRGFNEQLGYYCESANRDFFLDSPLKTDPSKNCWTHVKNFDRRKDPRKKVWTHAKKFDSHESTFDPRNPRKNYERRTHVTHVTT